MIVRYSPEKVREILELKGVPKELWAEAEASIADGYKSANGFKQLFHNLSAPFVVPFALIGVPWEAERLPEGMFHGYNNDATINGDVFVWDGDKTSPLSTDKDDQFAIDSNYWAKGHHPRSFWSRYMWLGIRNRGKETYLHDAPEIPNGQQDWGVDVTRGDADEESVPGWQVSRSGKHWQMIGVLPLVGGFFQEVRWGWKLGLWNYHYNYFDKNRVMAVGINLKFRKRSDN